MKKLLLLIAFVFSTLMVEAKDVTFEQARQKALAFMGMENKDDIIFKETRPAKSKERGNASYYVFGKVNGQGFVIISGEDRLPDVFGYSKERNFSSDDNMPPALINLLELYSEYVEAVRLNAVEAVTPQTRAMSSSIEVMPLLTSKWGQDEPYNRLCPESTVTGCVATALSQIMMYYKWPDTGNGYASTIYNSQSISVDLSKSVYNWSAMKDTKEENVADEAAAESVAKLCYDCGLALKMSYGSTSGAFDYNAVKALYGNFKYKGSSLRFANRNCFTTDEWMEMVKTELFNERPIYYSGASPSGGGKDAEGHAFVIDGCNSDDFVHVNWGWDGYADGYYDIALLNPDRYSFSQNQLMIAGITPNLDGEATAFVPYLIMDEGISTDTEYVLYNKSGSTEFNIIVPTLINPNPETLSGAATIRLYDEHGQVVKSDIKTSKMYTLVFELLPNYMTGGVNTVACKIPSGLEDGTYYMKVVTKYNDRKDWLFPDVMGGNQNNYIRAVIANGKVSFDSEQTNGINDISYDGPDDSSTIVYGIDGRKLSPSSAKGKFVIQKQSNNVRKVFVK